MSVIVFGKGDLVAVPSLDVHGNGFSSEVIYTRPNRNRLYSHHGFAHPCSLGNSPIDLILDNKFPNPPKHLVSMTLPFAYFVIDHQGLLWKKTFLFDKDDSRYVVMSISIDNHEDGWWICTDPEGDISKDLQLLLGFLYTDPSVKHINDYWYKQMGAKGLDWLSVKEVVNRLNKDYDPYNVPIT